MRRSRLELYLQILEICRKPSRKTWIVYRLNSNFREVEKLLKVLVNSGYVRVEGKSYVTTEKAVNALRYFSRACREYPEITPRIRV